MWTGRTGNTTVVLRPVMILDDDALVDIADTAEFGAFVHVEDVRERNTSSVKQTSSVTCG